MKRNEAAVMIQKHVRGWLEKQRTAVLRKNIIIAQAAVRQFLARRRFRKIKQEALSAEHLNKKLVEKIISLQQRIQELNKELKSSVIENSELKLQIEQGMNIQVELQQVTKFLKEKQEEYKQLHNILTESTKSLQEKDNENKALKINEKCFESINSQLQAELRSLRENIEQLKQHTQGPGLNGIFILAILLDFLNKFFVKYGFDPFMHI